MKIGEYPLVVYSTGKIDDIVFLEFPNSLRVDLSVAREIVANRLDFTKNEKHYLIIDISNVKEISLKAKEYMQRPDAGLRNILGAAFIANNPIAALIASIFVKTTKEFPARFFTERTEAYSWIFKYRQQMIGDDRLW
jgi:hypothetical protein